MTINTGAREAIGIGIVRAVKGWRLLLIFYVFNFVFAAVLTLPIATIFAEDVSRSLLGDELMKGFSYRWYVEFIHANGGFFNSLFPQVVAVFILYLLVEVFFAGGFYFSFSNSKRKTPGEFFAKGASSFFPLLGITIAEVGVLVLLYEGNSIWASINSQASKTVLSDYLILRADLWRYAAVAAAFIVISAVSDFVRVAVATDDDYYWGKVRSGFEFAVSHPFSSLGVYLGCMFMSGAVIAAYFFFNFNTHADTEGAVLLEIVVGQIFVLLRIVSKLIFYAGEGVLYKENQVEVIKVKPEMLE